MMQSATGHQHQPARQQHGSPPLLAAGFRPFFLLAAGWAVVAVPLWLMAYANGYVLREGLHTMAWHAHEMVFGFGLAAVAGFLLTAIPNWTGRPPLRGAALAALAALWIAGRVALLVSYAIGAVPAALLDLLFGATLIAIVAHELIAGRNRRNLPIAAALGLLLAGNTLVHLQATGVANTADLGNRLGIATLLALIALVGGRIVPNFTRNWLARMRPACVPPAEIDRIDIACMAAVVLALGAWVSAPASPIAFVLEVLGGAAAAIRLSRWRGLATLREPLLFVLHAGYAWLAFGLAFLGLNGLFAWLPPAAPLHVLTIGAIGTMTLGVMTRATLGHTGRALAADIATSSIYAFITLAVVLRIAGPLFDAALLELTSLAGLAWTTAFALFLAHFGPMLCEPAPSDR